MAILKPRAVPGAAAFGRLSHGGTSGIFTAAVSTFLAFALAFAAESPPRPAQGGSPPTLVSTPAIYAAFTLNLTRFISWPEGTFVSKTAPFVIGTFPRDPINDALDEAAKGEMVDGHAVRTIRIQSLDDLTKCQVVFLSKSNATRPAVLARVAHKPILTVSDAEGFLELGGHVRFVSDPPHTKLRVSAENLKASGLESRAQLLRLAATP